VTANPAPLPLDSKNFSSVAAAKCVVFHLLQQTRCVALLLRRSFFDIGASRLSRFDAHGRSTAQTHTTRSHTFSLQRLSTLQVLEFFGEKQFFEQFPKMDTDNRQFSGWFSNT
jgi:hypothetical protein